MANNFHEIEERPVDIFYGGVINCIILSFKNRPEIDAVAKTEAFITFLTDVWNKYFSDISDVLDFVRYCTYNTGLVGRFYRVNCFLPLDNVFYFLKESNRLPDPNSSKTWHTLHKLARLVLLEYCTEYSSDISFNLDVHVENGKECDASDSIASCLNLEDLPNEQDCVLVFHITITYNNNPKLLSSDNFSFCTSNYYNSKNEFCDSSEVTNIPKPTIAPKISDPISESPSGSNVNSTQSKDNPWEKYGAKPKTRYLQKNYYETSENQNENKNNKLSLISPGKQMHLTPGKDPLPQKNLRILREFEKIEDSLQDSTQKFRDLSVSQSLNVTRNIAPERRFEIMNREPQRNESTNVRNSSLCQQLPDQFLASSSGLTKQTDSVFDNKNCFTHFIDECFSSKPTQSNKCDQIFPAPWIPQKSEDNSYYKKRDGRIPDVQYSQNPECSASQNKDLHNQDLSEKGATASPHIDREGMIFSKLFPALEGVFATQKELDDMPEDMRQLQMKYEESVINMMKAEAMSELSSSDSNESELVEQSLSKDQRITEKEQDRSLQMPYICFTPQQIMPAMAEDNDNLYTFTTYIGLQVRESLLRYEVKKFFENYHFPDESSKSFPETFMKSRAVREYYDLYHSAGSTSNTSLLEYPKSIYETDTSDTRNQATVLNPDDPNSGHLAIRTFEDKMSFNWDYYQQRASDIESQSTPFSETSASATAKKDKIFIVDGEPVASGSSDEHLDMFFQVLVQKLTKNAPSTQATLPHESRAVPTSENKKYSSPEQASKYSDLNLAHVEKEDAITYGDISEDEMLYDVSEESLGLSDCDSSNEELASEFEQ